MTCNPRGSKSLGACARLFKFFPIDLQLPDRRSNRAKLQIPSAPIQKHHTPSHPKRPRQSPAIPGRHRPQAAYWKAAVPEVRS